MSIYKSKGKWKAEVWHNSKRVATRSGFERKLDAQRWKIEFLANIDVAPQKKKTPPVTFDALLERYETIYVSHLSSETRRRYQVDIDLRIRPYFRHYKLQAISPLMIEQFRSQLVKSHLSPKSINNCTSVLSTLFGKALEWGMLEHNPFKIKPLKAPPKRRKWWDEKALIRRFLEAIKDDPYEAAYRLGLECGLRLGEVVGLSKQDVSFEFGTIHIHRQWIEKAKSYGATKQNKDRYVKFSKDSALAKSLRRAIDRSPDPEIIFTTDTGKRVLSRGLSNQLMERKIKKAGVPMLTFHGLRHTFASWYMIEVGDIWSLMQILGHSSIKTTMRYAHVSGKHQKVPNFNWNEASPLVSLSSYRSGGVSY